MDYEELILERQELDYEEPAEELNPPKWYCIKEHKYMDCVECGKNCDWTKSTALMDMEDYNELE